MKIRNALFEYGERGKIVKLIWVPSHRGIDGNERADSLAKDSLHLPDPLALCKCHYTNIYSKFKKSANMEATDILYMQSTYKGSRYLKLKDKILSPPWFVNLSSSLPRPIIVLISRIRSHHVATNVHLWGKKIVDSPVFLRLNAGLKPRVFLSVLIITLILTD